MKGKEISSLPGSPRQNFATLEADASEFVFGSVPERRARSCATVEEILDAFCRWAGNESASARRWVLSGALICRSSQRAHYRQYYVSRKFTKMSFAIAAIDRCRGTLKNICTLLNQITISIVSFFRFSITRDVIYCNRWTPIPAKIP